MAKVLLKISLWFRSVAPGEWMLLLLGEILLQRYSWLLDDAYVYFRYVDNLVLLGRGLVYNPGEFVEGFSSPAWCLLLAVFRLSGCPYWLCVRILGALIFLIVWALLITLNRRFSPTDIKGNAVNYPLISIALTYGASCYFTSGVEGPLVILISVVVALLVLNPQSGSLQVWAGFAPLVRPELSVPWLMLVMYLRVRNGKFPILLRASGVLSSGAWTVFRVFYYADFLPNTFYLKSIHWYSQGLIYLWDTVLPYRLIPLAIFFVLLSFFWREKISQRLFLVGLALPVLLYVLRIGGDVRHFRYLLFPFVMFSCATGGLIEACLTGFGRYPSRKVVMGVVVLFASLTLSGFPRQLQSHPLIRPRVRPRTREYRIHSRIHDAAIHRSKYTPAYAATGAGEESVPEKRKAADLPPEKAGESIMVTPICRKAYDHWNERVIHAYGLTDAILARVEMPSVRPGHKEGLKTLAEDLAEVETRAHGETAELLRFLSEGDAPEWMLENRRALELLEQKIHNRHHFLENLKLALTRVPVIRVPRESGTEALSPPPARSQDGSTAAPERGDCRSGKESG